MIIRPGLAFAVLWLGWFVSWLAAAFWAGRTEKRAWTWETVAYRVALLVGTVLVFVAARRHSSEPRLWHVGYAGAWVLAGLTLAGLVFTWYARIHLGRLWSGAITLKEGHRIVDTGPYALVRHPIYTGLIFALLASSVAQARATALAGAALLTFGFWLKARAEEHFLMAELGEDAYRAYRRRVPMLVPFLPRGSARRDV
jgi:protein-S-isoprenylcysteine O-methyltransferase Ste14